MIRKTMKLRKHAGSDGGISVEVSISAPILRRLGWQIGDYVVLESHPDTGTVVMTLADRVEMEMEAGEARRNNAKARKEYKRRWSQMSRAKRAKL